MCTRACEIGLIVFQRGQRLERYSNVLRLGVSFPSSLAGLPSPPVSSRQRLITNRDDCVPGKEGAMSISQAHKELFGRLYHSIWNERRMEFIDRVIADTHAISDPTIAGGAVGPSAYRRQVERFLTGLPDLHFDVDDTITEKRSEEHTSELQSPDHLVCRLLLEKKKKKSHSSNTQKTDRHATTY